ncbi:MAG: hypothetical protein ACR2LK_14040 [Solirubrobacteraceae bacterium]
MTAPLPAEAVDAIARRVVDLLREEPALTTRHLVDAGTMAMILGVERSWIYEHAADLGAYRLGTGDRPRLRFDVDRALSASREPEQPLAPAPTATTPRRRAPRSSTDLLPVKGREAA